MVFWIILVLIAAFIVFHATRCVGYKHYWNEFLSGAAAIAVVGGLVGVVVCGVGSMAQDPGPYEKQSTYALRALITKSTNESSLDGTFFLGFGKMTASSKEVNSIAYMQTAEDGGSTLERIDVSNAVIYEDSLVPRVEEWVQKVHNNKIFVPWDYTIDSYRDSVEYRFHVPKGTILDHYQINQ